MAASDSARRDCTEHFRDFCLSPCESSRTDILVCPLQMTLQNKEDRRECLSYFVACNSSESDKL